MSTCYLNIHKNGYSHRINVYKNICINTYVHGITIYNPEQLKTDVVITIIKN